MPRTPETCPYRESEPAGKWNLVHCGRLTDECGYRVSAEFDTYCKRCAAYDDAWNPVTEGMARVVLKGRVMCGDGTEYVWHWRDGPVSPEDAAAKLKRDFGVDQRGIEALVDEGQDAGNYTPERAAEVEFSAESITAVA